MDEAYKTNEGNQNIRPRLGWECHRTEALWEISHLMGTKKNVLTWTLDLLHKTHQILTNVVVQTES